MKRICRAAALALTLCSLFTEHSASQASSDRSESVQNLIDQAVHDGKKRVVIPAGTYRIAPPAEGPHLRFENLSDFEIDASGATFVFTGLTRGGIEFRNCRNVTFRGAAIRYEVPPFTQGVVKAIAPDGASYDVQIDKGYPTDFDNPEHFPAQPTGYLFDPKTRWWKPGTYDLYGDRIERLGPDTFRLHWKRPAGPDRHPVSIGDPMGFRGSGRHNLTVMNSAAMHIEGVTILNAGSFAVFEGGGGGGNHYSVTVKRGPRPPGATADPLFSSTADAFHSANVRRGPVLENCYFESMPDDGVAIHGTYSLVLQAKDNALVINKNTFRPGDPLLLYDPHGQPVADARVVSVSPLNDFHNTKKSRRQTRSDNTVGPYFTLTLDRTIAADFDYLAANPAAIGAGYIVRHNTIRNHRARGMLLKSENGLVEDNVIDGSTMGGIVLTPEFWWNEADYSKNVIIRNNTVRHVAYAPHQLGAIVIAALDGDTPVPAYGNEHIVLENNRVEDVNGVNLLITSAQNVEVKNNHFANPQHFTAEAAGAGWGENGSDLMFITNAADVRLEGNVVSGLGQFNRALIKTTPSAKVQGSETGVSVRRGTD